MGTDLVLKAGSGLLDQAADDEQKKIEKLLDDHHPEFVNYHKIKTRRSGNKIFAELHLTMDPNITVQKAHDLTKHLEEDLQKELPEVSLTIHIEPPSAHGNAD
jgi:divalent metal cation (Fe/Co/Zn/Cd) transporter